MRHLLLLAVLLSFSATAPVSAQEAPASEQPELYSFWVNAGLFKGTIELNDTIGLRLAANVGEKTFAHFGAQTQSGGLTSGLSRTAVNVALGRSAVYEAGTASIYAGPMLAWSGSGPAESFDSSSEYLKVGVLGAARTDVHLFYGIGVGLEAHGSWVPGMLSAGVGLSLTFGGFDR